MAGKTNKAALASGPAGKHKKPGMNRHEYNQRTDTSATESGVVPPEVSRSLIERTR